MPTPTLMGPGSEPGFCRREDQSSFAAIRRSSRRAALSSILSRSAIASIPSFEASTSIACSSAKHPCGCPGARKAAAGPACVKTSYSSVRRFGATYMFFTGPLVPAPVPVPPVPYDSRWIAVSVPSLLAPIRSRCTLLGRLPTPRCSSLQSSMSRTGAPAFFERCVARTP